MSGCFRASELDVHGGSQNMAFTLHLGFAFRIHGTVSEEYRSLMTP